MSGKIWISAVGFLFSIMVWNRSVIGQEADNKYPSFTWDKVSVGFHFGNNASIMTKKEAKFVASHSNFICLEKGHAITQFGNTEEGIAKEAKQLKKFNPNMKVIFYWNTFLDYPMYKAHDEYEKHPEWWLKKIDGELDKKNATIKRYDLSNPEVRKWWTDVARENIVGTNCDGVFMDAFPQVTSEANRALWGEEKFNQMQQGLKDIIWETREALGEDKLIVYNGIRSTPTRNMGVDFPEYTDAVMLEHFGHFQSGSKECMLRDILEMQKAAKAGKIVVFKGWPGFAWIDKEEMQKTLEEKRKLAKENITFPLAAFLVGAQQNCYFVYNWGYRMQYGCLDWYPEFDMPLGEPLGDAIISGWELSREFEHLKVWVNLETKEAKITQRK
jgi:hypothetical protein